MLYMNEFEIDTSADTFIDHPILGRATRFLQAFRTEVNAHSDGWVYWRLPAKAARQLMELIQNPATATENKLKKSLVPIKAFYTRHGKAAGMTFPTIPNGS